MPVNTVAYREGAVLTILALLFVLLLYPALIHSRREYRDGIRRDEVALRKIELEQYFNEHNHYPLLFDASPHQYHVVREEQEHATGWYLRAELENSADQRSGYDAEAGRNYWYRIVSTDHATYYDVCGGGYDCAENANPGR